VIQTPSVIIFILKSFRRFDRGPNVSGCCSEDAGVRVALWDEVSPPLVTLVLSSRVIDKSINGCLLSFLSYVTVNSLKRV